MTNVEYICIARPRMCFTRMTAVKLSFGTHRISHRQRTIASSHRKCPILMAINFHRNNIMMHTIAYTIHLTIVRIGKDTFRCAWEIAIFADWIAWAGVIRTSMHSQITIFTNFIVARFHRNRFPSPINANASRQHTAILTNQTGCLTFRTTIRGTKHR